MRDGGKEQTHWLLVQVSHDAEGEGDNDQRDNGWSTFLASYSTRTTDSWILLTLGYK